MLYFKKLANHKGNWIKFELANHIEYKTCTKLIHKANTTKVG
jgi:hypothetical protein